MSFIKDLRFTAKAIRRAAKDESKKEKAKRQAKKQRKEDKKMARYAEAHAKATVAAQRELAPAPAEPKSNGRPALRKAVT